MAGDIAQSVCTFKAAYMLAGVGKKTWMSFCIIVTIDFKDDQSSFDHIFRVESSYGPKTSRA